jgi:molybdopterin/thiamine biosynthesis adenylyltransferase
MIYIIGCGGVGSWLAPAICPLVGPQNVTLIDGDTLEEKNLNRQLFDSSQIGQNKAEALAEKHRCAAIAEYYSESLVQHYPTDWLLVGVDNHAGRRAALTTCDISQCGAVFAANEMFSSEAFVYQPSWRDGPKDPRTYYPEINTDDTDDPRRSSVGCTGEAQVKNRQLITANMMAAALGAHLFVVWALEAGKMSKAAREHLPFKLVNNFAGNETHKLRVSSKQKDIHEKDN